MIDYERYLINLALTVLREVAEVPAVEKTVKWNEAGPSGSPSPLP
ncbi:hypothetical protein [Sphingomonas sp. CFBP9021]|nr:hypothetical protein [Sphingomonas sp. CFBP9021]MDY0969312.1 hypothetical protein [Sphingomonas sp. CFBP9021]